MTDQETILEIPNYDSLLKKKIEEISSRINFLRNVVILFAVFVIIILIPSMAIQDVLNPQLKVWLIGVMCFAFVGLWIALFLARGDATTTLFVTHLLLAVACIVLGIAFSSLQKIITN